MPARWTEAHHVPGWVHGSSTDINAMCLLCGGHHAMVDLGRYRIVMLDGIPHVIPPADVDPVQRPVRNSWWLHKSAARDLSDELRLNLENPAPGPAPPEELSGPDSAREDRDCRSRDP
jgi:hypothetical protein